MSNGWYRWLIICYRMLFLPAFLLMAPYYLGRMWQRGGYRRHWQHRFGFVPQSKQTSPLWIQAVSVGELEALQPLLLLLKQQAIPVYLTTTTSTGFRVAQKKYQALVDQIAYFPLDFWLFSRNAWRRIQPRAVLLMESELWPEHLFQATTRNVPVYLINGRCSTKTFSRYCKCLPLARIIFSAITKIFATTPCDQQRFQHLCPKSVPVLETGNLKIDAALCALQRQPLPITLLHWPQSVRILLGASTWPGEEAWLLEFFLTARKTFPDLRLVLVPRHAERRKELKNLLQQYPLRFDFRSMSQLLEDPEVYVVDTTGELQSFLQIADWVFIGKSLPPNYGGQTPIEAAAYGKPMVYGPHMENFETICKSLEAAKGAVRCVNKERVGECLLQWMHQPDIAKPYGQSAQQWIQAHKGATHAVFKDLLEDLNRPIV